MQNNKAIYNLEDLTSVKIRDKRKNIKYKHVAVHITGFWLWKTVEYNLYFHSLDWHYEFPKTREEMLKSNYQIHENQVYYKPYVLLKFCNGEEYTKEFENYEEALIWGNEQAKIIGKQLIIDVV